MTPEQIGLWAGLVLSLMIFSYVLGDNFLYRLAVFIFVGLAAGYVAVVATESVLLPWLNATALNPAAPVGERIVGALPLLLGLLLLLKGSLRLGRLGNLALAFVVGVGAAVAVIGALAGTLLPLAGSAGDALRLDPLNGFLIVLGVVCSLLYFQHLARQTSRGVRQGLTVRVFGTVGHGFIVVTLGALYAAAILTSLTIFSERIAFFLGHLGGG